MSELVLRLKRLILGRALPDTATVVEAGRYGIPGYNICMLRTHRHTQNVFSGKVAKMM
jgi:hypothetical protein